MACCRDSLVKLTFTSGPRKASNESSAPSGATRPGTRAFALDMSQLASEDRVPPLQALTAGKNVGPTKLAGIVKRRPAQRGSWLVLDCQAKAEPELGGARTVRAESRDTGDCFRRWAFLNQQLPATPCQRCRFALPVLPLRLADIAWPRPKRAAPKHACRFRTLPRFGLPCRRDQVQSSREPSRFGLQKCAKNFLGADRCPYRKNSALSFIRLQVLA